MKFNAEIFVAGLLFSSLSFAENEAPHLWWGHEALASDVEKCVLKSQVALLKNGYKNISLNEEYNFLYATKEKMRVGIQCLAQGNGSFVYVNVAGGDIKAVEQNRNNLLSAIN